MRKRRRRRLSPTAAWTLGGAAAGLALLAVVGGAALAGRHRPAPGVDPAVVEKENAKLGAEVARLAAARGKVEKELSGAAPQGTYVVVDTYRNRVRLYRKGKLALEDVCSTGTNASLADSASGRAWTFRTPRGRRTVRGPAVADPVWIRPDWAFIEEGLRPPAKSSERAEPDVLGKYAIPIGDGYFLHGTLYTRLLGYPATHGCVRLSDATLDAVVKSVRPGTPVILY